MKQTMSFPGKITLFFILLFTISHAATAQDAKTDILRVDQAYRAVKSLSVKMTYRLYATHDTKTVTDVQEGEYKKQGNHHRTRIAGVETLWDKDYTIVCDRNNEMIVIGNPVKVDIKPFQVSLDSLLKICSKVVATENATQRTYRLEFANSRFAEYTAMDVYINRNTWMIDRMVLFYRQSVALNAEKPDEKYPPRLEISYTDIRQNITFDEDEFAVSRYIETVKGKIKCAAAFSTYRLFNQKIR